MSQRVKRPNRTDDGCIPTKRRKRPTMEEEEAASLAAAASWQPRPFNDLKSIYNRTATEAPAELFRKDLISAMKLPDSEPLASDEYWVIVDQWKQEWERGVQVPVNPDSLPEPSVTVNQCSTIKPHQEFKIPKTKYIRITKDEHFHVDRHVLSTAPAKSEAACSYDLDETDVAWLKLLNGERAASGVASVSEEKLERVIERLEINCWDKIQSILRNEEGLGIEYDENVICDVCRSPDSEEGNEMVFCDSCNICVHQACYGITRIPEGQWLCGTCALSQRPECILCPNKGGAMKATRSGQKWAHVSCALWIPEVSIGCVEKMEPITKVSSIPQSRWALICVLCRERVGACIQCSVKTCKTAYHVTCAFKHGLEMRAIIEDENADDGVKLRSYCEKHSKTSKKEKSIASGSEDDDNKRKKRKDMTSEEKNQARAARLHEIEAEFDKHVNIKDVNMRLDIDNQTLQYIYNYWKLKRRAGNNKPLLPPKSEDVDVLSHKQEADLEKMTVFVHIRQDLERVRNLCYMVSRREKLSRTFFRMREQTFHKQAAVLESSHSLSASIMHAVTEANHGPSIYDRLYSHSDAEDHKDFELVLGRIVGLKMKEEKKTELNGVLKSVKKENPYKKLYFNGSKRRSESLYGSSTSEGGCAVSSSDERINHFKTDRVVHSSCNNSSSANEEKPTPIPFKRKAGRSRLSKKRRKHLALRNVKLESSSEDDVKVVRKSRLQQVRSDLGMSGTESDELNQIRSESQRSKVISSIYSESDSSNASNSHQSHFRTKAAVKEFLNKPSTSKSPTKTSPSSKKKSKPIYVPSDLIVPQREAAKKASQNMKSTSTRIVKEIVEQSPAQFEIKSSSPDVKVKSMKTKIKEAKSTPKKEKSVEDIFDIENEKEDEILLYVPQRQAAKKATENIKSGLGKPIPPSVIDNTSSDKEKLSEITAKAARLQEHKRRSFTNTNSSTSSLASSSSDSSSTSSTESESETNKPQSESLSAQTKRTTTAKDWPFLDKVAKSEASCSNELIRTKRCSPSTRTESLGSTGRRSSKSGNRDSDVGSRDIANSQSLEERGKNWKGKSNDVAESFKKEITKSNNLFSSIRKEDKRLNNIEHLEREILERKANRGNPTRSKSNLDRLFAEKAKFRDTKVFSHTENAQKHSKKSANVFQKYMHSHESAESKRQEKSSVKQTKLFEKYSKSESSDSSDSSDTKLSNTYTKQASKLEKHSELPKSFKIQNKIRSPELFDKHSRTFGNFPKSADEIVKFPFLSETGSRLSNKYTFEKLSKAETDFSENCKFPKHLKSTERNTSLGKPDRNMKSPYSDVLTKKHNSDSLNRHSRSSFTDNFGHLEKPKHTLTPNRQSRVLENTTPNKKQPDKHKDLHTEKELKKRGVCGFKTEKRTNKEMHNKVEKRPPEKLNSQSEIHRDLHSKLQEKSRLSEKHSRLFEVPAKSDELHSRDVQERLLEINVKQRTEKFFESSEKKRDLPEKLELSEVCFKSDKQSLRTSDKKIELPDKIMNARLNEKSNLTEVPYKPFSNLTEKHLHKTDERCDTIKAVQLDGKHHRPNLSKAHLTFSSELLEKQCTTNLDKGFDICQNIKDFQLQEKCDQPEAHFNILANLPENQFTLNTEKHCETFTHAREKCDVLEGHGLEVQEKTNDPSLHKKHNFSKSHFASLSDFPERVQNYSFETSEKINSHLHENLDPHGKQFRQSLDLTENLYSRNSEMPEKTKDCGNFTQDSFKISSRLPERQWPQNSIDSPEKIKDSNLHEKSEVVHGKLSQKQRTHSIEQYLDLHDKHVDLHERCFRFPTETNQHFSEPLDKYNLAEKRLPNRHAENVDFFDPQSKFSQKYFDLSDKQHNLLETHLRLVEKNQPEHYEKLVNLHEFPEKQLYATEKQAQIYEKEDLMQSDKHQMYENFQLPSDKHFKLSETQPELLNSFEKHSRISEKQTDTHEKHTNLPGKHSKLQENQHEKSVGPKILEKQAEIYHKTQSVHEKHEGLSEKQQEVHSDLPQKHSLLIEKHSEMYEKLPEVLEKHSRLPVKQSELYENLTNRHLNMFERYSESVEKRLSEAYPEILEKHPTTMFHQKQVFESGKSLKPLELNDVESFEKHTRYSDYMFGFNQPNLQFPENAMGFSDLSDFTNYAKMKMHTPDIFDKRESTTVGFRELLQSSDDYTKLMDKNIIADKLQNHVSHKPSETLEPKVDAIKQQEVAKEAITEVVKPLSPAPMNKDSELLDFDLLEDGFGISKAPLGFPLGNVTLFKEDSKEDSARETLNLVEKLRLELSKKSSSNHDLDDTVSIASSTNRTEMQNDTEEPVNSVEAQNGDLPKENVTNILNPNTKLQADERWVPPSNEYPFKQYALSEVGSEAPLIPHLPTPYLEQSSPSPYADIHPQAKWADSQIMPTRRSSSSSAATTPTSGSPMDEERSEVMVMNHPNLEMQFGGILHQLQRESSFPTQFSDTQFINPVSLFPPPVPNYNSSIPFPSPGTAMFPTVYHTSTSLHSKPVESTVCTAAFTSSEHNMALTAAMVNLQTPNEPINNLQTTTDALVGSQVPAATMVKSTTPAAMESMVSLLTPTTDTEASPKPTGKKSPNKPTRMSARFQNKSPEKSPRTVEVPKTSGPGRGRNSDKRGGRGLSRGRGRGRGRGKTTVQPQHQEYEGNTINKLVGTVYDFDFDDDNDNMGDLKSMRERRKSADIHTQSPKLREIISPILPTPPIRSISPPPPPIVEPVLPGPVDMRTYSNFDESQSYGENNLLSALRGTSVPVHEDIDEDFDKVFCKVEPEIANNIKASLSDSRNQLKVKIKGPIANYTASVPPPSATSNVSANNVINSVPVGINSGTSNLRRMRKKELLRQYWTQENMDDNTTVPGIAVVPTVPSINRTIITIPKAVASMTSIPTRDDYRDYRTGADDVADKARKESKARPGALSRELKQLDLPATDGTENASTDRRRMIVRGKAVKLAPKLKIKIAGTHSIITDTSKDRIRPPKKRLSTIAQPNVEDLKRESMKFRKMVMADFGDKRKKKKDKSSKHRKRKNQQVQIVSNEDANPTKLIIRFSRKADSESENKKNGDEEVDKKTNTGVEVLKDSENNVRPIKLKLARCQVGSGYVMKTDETSRLPEPPVPLPLNKDCEVR